MSNSLARRCAAVAAMALAGGCCKPENKADVKVFWDGSPEVLTMASVRTTDGVFGLEPPSHHMFEGRVPIPVDGVYHLEWWTASGKVFREDCTARVAPGHVLAVVMRFSPLRIDCFDAGVD